MSKGCLAEQWKHLPTAKTAIRPLRSHEAAEDWSSTQHQKLLLTPGRERISSLLQMCCC